MSILYMRLSLLCKERGISAYRMCKDCSIQPSVMTDLKMGRKKSMNAETIGKIADYFCVSSDYLLGKTDIKAPPSDKSTIADPQIEELLKRFLALNSRGKQKVLDYASDIAANDKNTI